MTREEMLEVIMKYASKLSTEYVRKLLTIADWYFVNDPYAVERWEEETA